MQNIRSALLDSEAQSYGLSLEPVKPWTTARQGK